MSADKKLQTDTNVLNRSETAGWQQRLNEREEVRMFLMDEDNVKNVKDYIFGVIDVNPLKDIRSKYGTEELEDEGVEDVVTD